MKRFSIKQLVLVFIIGSVLLTGARFFAMDTVDFEKGNRSKIIKECMVNGDFSEEDAKDCLKQGESQRGFRIIKHR